jgi:DnaJ-class molecular chaperone
VDDKDFKPGDPKQCTACGGSGRQRWVKDGDLKEKECGVCHGTGRTAPMKTTK